MIEEINVDVDETKQEFRLNGNFTLLLSNRRAKIFINDYLHANYPSNNEITIGFEFEDQEKVLQKIQGFLKKFGYKQKNSQEVQTLLKDYFQEDENFRIFSHEAYLIRNNELDQIKKHEFKLFTL